MKMKERMKTHFLANNLCPEHYGVYFEAGNYWLKFMLQIEDP